MSKQRKHNVDGAPQPQLPTAPMLFEVAWEVCCQLGGIYTVIRSKAPGMVQRWGQSYVAVGPWNPELSPQEFEEAQPPVELAGTLDEMRNRGMGVRFGTWLITGRPSVILLDIASVMGRLGEAKYFLWKYHDIPAGDNQMINEVIAFGYMVEQLFSILCQRASAQDDPLHGRRIIGHFHEWMAGSAIPVLRRTNVPVSILFTTHATLLGRYLAQADPWFYDHVPFVDWLGDARRFNIESQVRIERAAAHGCHVFTTLSDITAFECEHLLGRRPELLLPNGLNIDRFMAVHEFQNLHRVYKEQINRFVMAHFFPSYTFDLDRTLYFFTSGRYEYRNKGFDLVIDSLARLNARMKAERINRTVVFFLVTRRPFRSINPDALHRRALMEEIRSTCDAIKDQVGQKLFEAVASGTTPKLDDLVDDYWRMRLRRNMQAWKSQRLPLMVTHDLVDDSRDEALEHLRQLGLINSPHDPVKVVYHPNFVTSSDPLFGMDYDQFVRGCHLGIFPSFYEPWGYTPEECIARGVPAVTSDLSGFGTYLAENLPDYRKRGLFVVHRRASDFERSSQELTEWLLEFTRMERRDRITHRNQVESISDHFDWGNLLCYYQVAYDMVLRATAK